MPIDDSVAGLSHELNLNTPYYNATIPIWVDEIPDVDTWRTEFLKEEAGEVVSAVGGWIFCFRQPLSSLDLDFVRDALEAISEVVDRHVGFDSESVRLAVAMPQSMTPHLEKSYEEWDEICGNYRFEYVDFMAKGKNQFGGQSGFVRLAPKNNVLTACRTNRNSAAERSTLGK